MVYGHNKPPAGTPINYNHPLSKGLVGVVLFNEGAGKPFLTGVQKQQVATVPAGVTWTFGPSGTAMNFDHASASYLDFGLVPSLDLTTQGTLLSRVYISSTTSTGYNLCCKENLSAGRNGYGIWTQSGTGSVCKGAMELATASTFTDYIAADLGPLSTKQWGTVGMSFNTGAAPILAEGGRNFNTSATAAITVAGSSAFNFQVGGSSTLPAQQWLGAIDYIYVWNRNLSLTELQQISQYPFCIYEPASSRFHSFPSTIVVASHSSNMALFA